MNGKPITGEHGLHPGDRIAAGHLMIDFRIGGSDTEHTIVFVDPAPFVPHATTIETDLAGALIEPAVTSPVKAQSTAPTKAPTLAGQQRIRAARLSISCSGLCWTCQSRRRAPREASS